AHDEPAIRLDMFEQVFSVPAALCYLTESERQLVQARFSDRPLLEEVAGIGVDMPQHHRYPRPAGRPASESAGGADDADASAGGEPAAADGAPMRERGSHLHVRGAVFRRRHRLWGPLILYGGRIDPGKGCEELMQYFSEYVKEGGDGTLALMGVKLMPLPEEPFVRFAGLLSERERLLALEAATAAA